MIKKLLCIMMLGLGIAVPQYGQVVIYGKLTDKEQGTPISYVQVVLYRYQTTEVVAYQLSDEQGNYRLAINDKGLAFTLKTNSLTHKNLEKDLILDVQNAQQFQIDLVLESVAHTLTEVQIRGKLPPLIVKKDTIVYNIGHWQDEQDQSLEAVLAKIPGFEILSNGELKVNGKQVQKVLVNGEEISDAGAAMLTRNITPDRVKSVEVRFDEKNEKIKESLLDNDKFVVLDIKLKEDQNHDFFGRATVSAGLQAGTLQPGASLKSFSLRKTFKTQILGEYEAFGDKSIKLSSIQNLGAEAYAKIFEIPADFNDFRSNPEFNNEIYGFREYTRNQSQTLGINSKIDLSPKLELFLGSYFAIDKVGTQNDLTQFYLNDSLGTNSLQASQNLFTLQSKSKAELVLTQKNSKLRYNFNVVLGQNDRTQNQDQSAGNTYRFANEQSTEEYYHNLFFEQRFGEKSGFQVNALYSTTTRDANWNLSFQDSSYSHFFNASRPNPSKKVSQRLPFKQTQGVVQTFYQKYWKNQLSKLGLRFRQEQIEGEKQFYFGENQENSAQPQTVFDGQLQTLTYTQILPYLEQELSLGSLSTRAKLGWSLNLYPEQGQAQSAKKNILEWSLGMTYPLNDKNDFSLSFTQTTSAFPLRSMLPGQEMLDFQTILIPNRVALQPQQERLASFSYNSFALQKLGMVVEFSAIAGKAFNNAGFGFNSSGLVEQYIDQSPSHYYIAVGKIGKVFNDFPVQIKLEPSIIYNKNSFRNELGEGSFIATQISTLHLKFFSDFKKQTFDFESGIKYSRLRFSQEEQAARGQEMLNFFFKYKQSLWQRKLQSTLDWRYTHFSGSGRANVLILDAQIRYVHRKTAFSLQVNNLFNAQRFVQQSITPAFFIDASQYIFGRYGKLGVSFDLN